MFGCVPKNSLKNILRVFVCIPKNAPKTDFLLLSHNFSAPKQALHNKQIQKLKFTTKTNKNPQANMQVDREHQTGIPWVNDSDVEG